MTFKISLLERFLLFIHKEKQASDFRYSYINSQLRFSALNKRISMGITYHQSQLSSMKLGRSPKMVIVDQERETPVRVTCVGRFSNAD